MAARVAVIDHAVHPVAVAVIDNGSRDVARLDALLDEELDEPGVISHSVHRGHGNVGYGRGHNIGILGSPATYHLVLNPDVVIDEQALSEAARFLDANPGVGLLTPEVRGPDGRRQYLCRTYPDVLTLLLRGFAPDPVRRLFASRLARYELRNAPPRDVTFGITIASGCFMFARRADLEAAGGFSSNYFLYFEDYDLSLALGRRSEIAYVSTVRIVHSGGGVPRKGIRHILRYCRSALTFFSRHGWRLI
jgi:GT2 family glycosyltransferase